MAIIMTVFLAAVLLALIVGLCWAVFIAQKSKRPGE